MALPTLLEEIISRDNSFAVAAAAAIAVIQEVIELAKPDAALGLANDRLILELLATIKNALVSVLGLEAYGTQRSCTEWTETGNRRVDGEAILGIGVTGADGLHDDVKLDLG
jgi:hypothetical protein